MGVVPNILGGILEWEYCLNQLHENCTIGPPALTLVDICNTGYVQAAIGDVSKIVAKCRWL